MMKASSNTIKSAMTGLTQGWPTGTTMSKAASHICISAGIVFITKIYHPAYKKAMWFLRGTHVGADARNTAAYQGDKRSDMPAGLPGDDRGTRRTGVSSILAHDDKGGARDFYLSGDCGRFYRRAYESTFNTRSEPNGAVLLIIAVILILFFRV
jgi:hypothetical protein